MRRRDVLALPPIWFGLLRAGAADARTPTRGPLRLGPYLCDPRPTGMGFYLAADPERLPRLPLILEVAGGADDVARARVFVEDEYGFARVDRTDLRPATAYRYRVKHGDEVVGQGSFRTPPRHGTGHVRLAVSADLHVESRPYLACEAIADLAPDAMIALGDQVYADASPTHSAAKEPDYRRLYEEAWDDPHLRRCWAHVPTFLMWDDHEIVNDYDGDDPRRFGAARRAFDDHQARRNPAPHALESRDFDTILGPVELFVLDTRSCRARNDAPDGPEKSMLGVRQREALLEFLARPTESVRIVASPTPFHALADTGRDAWAAGFATERAVLWAAFDACPARTLVLLSGDQHWPAVVRHVMPSGRVLHELQCTPLGAFRRPPPAAVPPEVLFVGDGSSGFGLLDVALGARGHEVRFAWHDARGRSLYELPLVTPAEPRRRRGRSPG